MVPLPVACQCRLKRLVLAVRVVLVVLWDPCVLFVPVALVARSFQLDLGLRDLRLLRVHHRLRRNRWLRGNPHVLVDHVLHRGRLAQQVLVVRMVPVLLSLLSIL